jgi:serine/threonine-protein kinase
VFEGFAISAAIGDPGGFARVYRAKCKGDGQAEVAIKIFHSVSLAALEREVDVLKRVIHPNIVRILDHGKAVTGQVYLIMEYLDGRSLADRCDRSSRLDSGEVELILGQLLSALVALHPDEELLTRLRRNAELSAEEFSLLGRARHGYVHRDIKPENVMLVPQRGPVLIDFSIAVRAALPVTTISSTPGYLPPDGIGPGWSPDVDLFQLGLTILQVACGHRYDGENLGDLRTLARSDLPPRLSDVLLRLTADDRTARYASARSACQGLGIQP